MYSRGYRSDGRDKMNIPEGYDGTALLESEPLTREEPRGMHEIPAEHPKKEIKISPPIHSEEEAEEVAAKPQPKKFSFKDLWQGLPLGRLKGLLERKGDAEPLFSFDFEDLLIIGIALFLILSRNGDKELGFMLAALIFIK